MIDFNGKELNALRRRRLATTNVVAEVKPKKKPRPKADNHWTVIGSGPSGRDIPAKDLAGHVICINTSITWTPLECVTHYFFRKGRQHKMFADLVKRGIQLVAFRRGRDAKWWPRQPAGQIAKTRGLERRAERDEHPQQIERAWRRAEALGSPRWVRHVEQLKRTIYPDWDPFDEPPGKLVWIPGTYTGSRDPAGPTCVQYACNHRADRIDLYGMEGGQREDDGTTAQHWQVCADYHQVVIQACVDACPDTTFTQYGDPMFRLTGQNVKHKLSKVRPTTNTDIGEPEPEA